MKQTLTFVLTLFVFTCASFGQEEEDFNFLERPIESFSTEIYLPTLGWVTSSRTTLYYNSNNQVVSQIMEVVNFETMALETTGRATITYNSAGSPVEDLQEEYDSETDTWTNSYRSEYTFSGNDVLNSLTQMWDGDGWVNASRSSYSYSDGLQSEEIEESWNKDTSSWILSEKAEYSYNTEGKLVLTVYYLWSTALADWEFDWQETISRGSSSRTTLTEDYEGGEWINSLLSTATIDEDGFVVESIDQTWDTTNEEWVNESRNIRSKNDDGWIDTILIQTWYDITENWEDGAKIIFSYRNSLGIEKLEAAGELTVYPNPAQNILNISDSHSLRGFKIYSLNGQEIKNYKLNSSRQLDVSSLQKGMYVLSLEDGTSQTQFKKFIKK
tara:strand:+ start:2084 stop:3238 length:1155 start_codon:yes stop_codon:yes gene_type:complete